MDDEQLQSQPFGQHAEEQLEPRGRVSAGGQVRAWLDTRLDRQEGRHAQRRGPTSGQPIRRRAMVMPRRRVRVSR